MKNAFLSVSDKTNLDQLAKHFYEQGVNMIATGGTKKYIEDAGYKVQSIEEITRKPEAFQGRMKSISFELASGILFRRGDMLDEEDKARLEIPAIDYVVINFYPFEKKVEEGLEQDRLVDFIDIGGPSMLRAGAKNFAFVTALSNPQQYHTFITQEKAGTWNEEMRKSFALEAFDLCRSYDEAIVTEFRSTKLRYGENPKQTAIVDYDPKVWSIVFEGKALSYNNWLDATAARNIMVDFHNTFSDKATVCVMKHANPCGLATASTNQEALEKAWAGDPVSAFGSIIAFTKQVDASDIEFLNDKFVELILAPSFTEAAITKLKTKKNLRLLTYTFVKESSETKSFSTLQLKQSYDATCSYDFIWKTKKQEASKEVLAHFSYLCAKHLKSNAIALCREDKGGFQMVGAGMGQPNRIDCLKRLAVPRMQEYFSDIKMQDLFLASDAFFPFADTVELANEFGIQWLIQPGGSIRDDEVIEAANKNNMGMIFTGQRHFRH